VHILLTDETNIRPDGNVTFFVYGGILFPIEQLLVLHNGINRIRIENGYTTTDMLKFDTRSRPEYVSVDEATTAKNSVIKLCLTLGVKFIVHIIHHGIIRNQDPDIQLKQAADYVIGRYNQYLNDINDYGICVVDRFSKDTNYSYSVTKFTKGLRLHNGYLVNLDRIIHYSSTCIGASHANSAVDIVLGSLRYCINNPKNEDVASIMAHNVIRMMWAEKRDGKLYPTNKGFIIRPNMDKVRQSYGAFLDDYNELIANLKKLFRLATQK